MIIKSDPTSFMSVVIFVAISLLPGFASIAGTITSELKYVREIKPCEQKSTVAAVWLDKTIYNHIDAFRDIRIIGADDSEIPFRTRISRKSQTKTIKTAGPSKIISLKRLPGNKIEIILKNSDKKRTPVSLTIRTPSRNYDKRISVSTSFSKSGDFSPFGSEQSVFDYSAIIPLSNNNVKLPQTPQGRFYKITISNFSELKRSKRMELIKERRAGGEFSEIKKVIRFDDEFKIDSVTLNFEKRVDVKKAPVQEAAESAIIANSVIKKKSVVILETYRQPMTRVIVETPSLNFKRAWEIFASKDKNKWRFISSGTITKIKIGNYEKIKTTLDFPETRRRYLKLVVRNLDAPPIKISKVECFRNAYLAEFIIPTEGGDNLKFYYGGDLSEPRYDIDAILAGISDNASPIMLTMGPEKNNPEYNFHGTTKSFWESKTLMYVIIGVVCLFLGMMLLSGFKKIVDVPEE